MEPNEQRLFDLAMVDVELFVGSGVPRHAFTMIAPGPSEHWPRWQISNETLRGLGWTVERGSFQPPSSLGADLEAPHPYDLGSEWVGGNSWRAVFTIPGGGDTIEGFVDHEACGSERLVCDPGPELPSGSPWRWRVDGLHGGVRCGRAENPVRAAAAVEELVMKAGAAEFSRTRTRRVLSH